jgi:formylglycine-generating enzyme required for sulfatase activity
MTLAETAQAILRARDADFAALARIGGLDPTQHFRGADLRNVDFGDDDLSGFDFREADFCGADLSRARGLRPEMFVGARFDADTRAPDGLFGPAKPDWASAIGRDEYGVFVTITVSAVRGRAVTQRLRWIPPGRFMMGSPGKEPGRYDDEGPRHAVTLGQGFWLFDTPCTQALWRAVMGRNPSQFKSPTRPVESVSFDDVQDFLRRVNDRVPGLKLFLPSEAQWEYACRAGTTEATYAGPMEILGENNAPVLDAIAWYGGNSGVDFELKNGFDTSGWSDKQYPHERAGTHPSAAKAPNPWGLFDMLGNVWEWCADHWHENYRGAPANGSAWIDAAPDAGAADRVFRGGPWYDGARNVRAACRYVVPPTSRIDYLGFRCARVQDSEQRGAARRAGRRKPSERSERAATTSP